MAIFYHVSTDLKHTGEFYPRIPDNRFRCDGYAEDDKVPRISVAPTIENCLTAIPGCGGSLDETNIDRQGYYKVFKIDTEKLGISDEFIISSEYLFDKNLVPDAYITDEYWITKPFVVPKEDSFIIKLVNWNEECEDVIPAEIYKIADKEYEGDYLTAYVDIYKCNPPCTTVIKNAVYYYETLLKGEEIEFDILYEGENEILKDIVTSYYKNKLEIKKENDCYITFRAIEDCNLRKLFILHYNNINY